MRLFYTITSGVDQIQPKPSNSLGGFRSSSPVPNGTFSNLFGEISKLTVQRGDRPQYIGLILRNETGAAVTNVEIWFDYPEGAYSTFRIAAVALTANGQMEDVPNSYSKPLNATFFEANGSANLVGVGDIAQDGQLGIWIERTLDIDLIRQTQANIYEPTAEDPRRFQPIELDKVEDIKINIKWD